MLSHLCKFMCASALFLENTNSLKSSPTLALKMPQPPLPYRSLSLEERNLIQTSHLG